MDWDIDERYHAVTLLALFSAISFLLLFFSKTVFVQSIRSGLHGISRPVHRLFSGAAQPIDAAPGVAASPVKMETGAAVPAISDDLPAVPEESRRQYQVLQQENQRLRDVLGLQKSRWPKSVAARVIGRDPQRWFQEIVIDRGEKDGLTPGCAVVALSDNHEGLIGRINEVMPTTSKVLLIHDSLSAVAARLVGSTDADGVVEGTNGHELWLKYLDRNSPVKIGDAVVTAGLDERIPPEIPLGFISEIRLDPRQLFLEAQIEPAVHPNRLRMVLVLKHDS